MRWRRLLIPLVAMVGTPLWAQEAALVNPGFEGAPDGALPEGWTAMTQGGAGFEIASETGDAPEGESCITIRCTLAQTTPRNWTAFQQEIAADALRGKRVRLAASVRAEGAEPWGGAGLWIQINAADGSVLFLDNMRNRLLKGSEWTACALDADVPAGAATISLGGLLLGAGRAWFDAFTLDLVGDSPDAAPPAPLSDRGAANLAALARLVGVVRFFHPSPQSRGLDWDDFTSRAARYIEPAESAEDLAARLARVFGAIAPTVAIGTQRERPPAPAGPVEGDVRAWDYRGYSTSGPNESPLFHRRALMLADDDPLPAGRLWTSDLPGGVACVVPLYGPAASDAPAPETVLLQAPIATSGDDRWTRLAGVVTLWNAVQHFHPYLAESGCDWGAVLESSLRRAATDADARAFVGTLRQMTHCLNDGQVFVQHESVDLSGGLPLAWAMVGGDLLVTGVGDANSGLSAGDRVLSIDGKGAAAAVSDLLPFISASPHRATEQALLLLARGPRNSPLELQVETTGGLARRLVMRRRPGPVVTEQRPSSFGEIEPGIWYLDLSRTRAADLRDRLDDLAGARGLVFDVRGFVAPEVPPLLLGHLAESAVSAPVLQIPIITRPDRKELAYTSDPQWTIAPLDPPLRAPVVFLADARTSSGAESLLATARHHGLGTIVGGATAGANGNAAQVLLPGGYVCTITALRIEYPDGSTAMGAGVQPDRRVVPTRDAIAAGRDEVLEAALEALKGG